MHMFSEESMFSDTIKHKAEESEMIIRVKGYLQDIWNKWMGSKTKLQKYSTDAKTIF